MPGQPGRAERASERKRKSETPTLTWNRNEPRYCYCQNVSYGEMVGCDNDDCPYEWFHLACLGLTHAPTGSWLCDNCRPGGGPGPKAAGAAGAAAPAPAPADRKKRRR